MNVIPNEKQGKSPELSDIVSAYTIGFQRGVQDTQTRLLTFIDEKLVARGSDNLSRNELILLLRAEDFKNNSQELAQ
jgi:hypothetical protein